MNDISRHRTLQVLRTERLTPRMARVTLGGEELAGFPAHGPDQRIKMFFPVNGQSRPQCPGRPPAGRCGHLGSPDRSSAPTPCAGTTGPPASWTSISCCTVRTGRRVVGGGRGAGWGAGAAPGDWVGVSEPGGRYLPDADEHLVIGDESALPAIATVLEALPAGVATEVFVEVADPGEEQPLPSPAAARVHWLHRDGHAPGAALDTAVRAAEWRAGGCQAWVSAESATVRGIRAFLLDERGLSRRQVYATGYWRAH